MDADDMAKRVADFSVATLAQLELVLIITGHLIAIMPN